MKRPILTVDSFRRLFLHLFLLIVLWWGIHGNVNAQQVTQPQAIATSYASDGATLAIPIWKGYMLESNSNNVWLVYSQSGSSRSNIIFTTDGGSNWSSNVFQAANDGNLDMHSALFGKNGDLFFTWPGASSINFRKIDSPAHDNSSREPIYAIPGTSGANRSSVMTQSSGRIWVFTRLDGTSAQNVNYHYSDNNGLSWTNGVAFATNFPIVRIGSIPYVNGNPALVVLYSGDNRGYEYYIWNGTSFEAKADHSIYPAWMGDTRVFTNNVVNDTTMHLIFGLGNNLIHVWKNYNNGQGTWNNEIIDSSPTTLNNDWFTTSTVRGGELFLFYTKKSASSFTTSQVYYKKWNQASQTWTASVLVSGTIASNRDPNTCFQTNPSSNYIPVFWNSDPGSAKTIYFAKILMGTAPVDTTPPSVTVSVPNGGETLSVGSSYNIIWTDNDNDGIAAHKLEYSIDGGTNWLLIRDWTTGDPHTFAWTVPNAPSIQSRIRASVRDNTGLTNSDISNNNFTIRSGPVLTTAVTLPNGGETLTVGANYNIIWTDSSSNGITAHKLEYSIDGGTSWILIRDWTTGDPHAFAWTVPNAPSIQSRIRVSVRDNTGITNSDISNNNFTIRTNSVLTATVALPNGGETLTVGSSYNITWTDSSSYGISAHKLEYSIDGGTNWLLIRDWTTGDPHTFAWTVPNAPSILSRIRVSVRDNTGLTNSDISNNNFTIRSQDRPPVVVPIPPQVVIAGGHLSVPITASDPDGNTIILSAQQLPLNSTFIDSTGGRGAFIFDPSVSQAGSYQVRIIASSNALADTEFIGITVTPNNPGQEQLTSPVNIATTSQTDGSTIAIPLWKGYMSETDPNSFWLSYSTLANASGNIKFTTDGGNNWNSNIFQVGSDGYLDCNVSLFGQNNNLYITWPGASSINFRKIDSPAHDNSSREAIYTIPGTSSTHRSSIMIQNSGRIWIFTRQSGNSAQNVYYHYSDNNGLSWTNGVAFTTNYPDVRIGSMPYVNGNPALVVLYSGDNRGYEYYVWNGTSFEAKADHSIYPAWMGDTRVFTNNVVNDTTLHLIFGLGNNLIHVWKNYNNGRGTWNNEIVDSSPTTLNNDWFTTSTVMGDNLYLFYTKKSSSSFTTSQVYYKRWSQSTQSWTAPVLVSAQLGSNRDPNTCFHVPQNSNYIPVFWNSGSGSSRNIYFAKIVLSPAINDVPLVIVNSPMDSIQTSVDEANNMLESNSTDLITGAIPTHYSLAQSYPNPFNLSTTIKYELPNSEFVNISVYDLLGRKMTELVNEDQQAGYHSVIWNAAQMPSGMYFYRIQAGPFTEIKKMTLLK